MSLVDFVAQVAELYTKEWELTCQKFSVEATTIFGVHHKDLVKWENQPQRLTGIVPW